MIYLAGDHHAEPALVRIRAFLTAGGREFKEYGYQSGKNATARLHDFIPEVARAVRDEPGSSGILVCGTGVGVEIGANRFRGIRASLCDTPKGAEWARAFDDANVLCLASWALDEMDLDQILTRWFAAQYDGDSARRVLFNIFDSWAAPS
jgi:ribose 5-phosphate isomerase B